MAPAPRRAYLRRSSPAAGIWSVRPDGAFGRRGNVMAYAVKELFHTLQGEGAQAGRAAVFCRFAGCNLWSGREEDRASAACTFCDTDFIGMDGEGGGRFATPEALASAIADTWAGGPRHRYVVFTGGEPLLQLDPTLIAAVHALGFEVAVETNGTIPAPEGIDWICVSPKAGNAIVQRTGHELKAGLPAGGRRSGQLRGPRFPASLAPAHGWARPPRQHGRGRGVLPAGRTLAPLAPDAQDHRDSMTPEARSRPHHGPAGPAGSSP